MKPTNFLALKYLFSKTRFNIVSIVSLFSIIVLSVGYFSFTVILSVLSGLENYSLQFSKSFDPEIKVSQENNRLIILDDDDLDFLSKHENNTTKVLKGNVLIENNGDVNYAEIIGVDKNFNNVIDFSKLLGVGSYKGLNEFNSYTSYSLTEKLDLNLFSAAGAYNVYSINNIYPDVLIRPFKNSVVLFSDGVFTSRNDSEENVIVADLSVVQNLFGLNEYTCSEIYFSDSKNNGDLKLELKDHFAGFKVQSHDEINDTLYKMIQSEKLAVTLIMIMIIIISAFNVISSVLILVIEKENDIKTLKFLGLNKRDVQSVFFKNGLLLNGLGIFIGSIIGTILIILQKNLALIKVGGMNLAYPVEITASNYVIILVVGLVVAVLSSYFSSLAVKKL
ncbi:MAG: ABC transporter permease [Flavobacteriaceae bacterium]|nr:ABC transporter permease [Flavobacteriaceae bacterium]